MPPPLAALLATAQTVVEDKTLELLQERRLQPALLYFSRTGVARDSCQSSRLIRQHVNTTTHHTPNFVRHAVTRSSAINSPHCNTPPAELCATPYEQRVFPTSCKFVADVAAKQERGCAPGAEAAQIKNWTLLPAQKGGDKCVTASDALFGYFVAFMLPGIK
jgi:hypothetical protein